MRSPSTSAARPLVLLVSLAFLPGCASSGGSLPAGGSVRGDTQLQTDYGTRSITLRTVEDIYVREDTLAGGGEDLLRHVAATYDELGIPINTVNAEARLMGAVEARLRGDLGGRPLSRYFRCGSSITGSIADQYEVYVTALTQLESLDGGRTLVASHARAFAVQGGRSGNDIRCSTRSRLEREIFEQLERKVASAP